MGGEDIHEETNNAPLNDQQISGIVAEKLVENLKENSDEILAFLNKKNDETEDGSEEELRNTFERKFLSLVKSAVEETGAQNESSQTASSTLLEWFRLQPKNVQYATVAKVLGWTGLFVFVGYYLATYSANGDNDKAIECRDILSTLSNVEDNIDKATEVVEKLNETMEKFDKLTEEISKLVITAVRVGGRLPQLYRYF